MKMIRAVPGSVLALSMKRLALLLFLVCSSTLHAWNSTGHKQSPLIAYEWLTPTAKKPVDQLLARHPDCPKWIPGVVPADPSSSSLDFPKEHSPKPTIGLRTFAWPNLFGSIRNTNR